jgi:hypothetical protein
MRESEISAHHADVKQQADLQRADNRKLDSSRERALDWADRREWAQKKYAIGGELRWQETVSETPRHGRRRFVFDPITEQVKEIL